MIYDGQDDDVCEDILVLKTCSNVSILEKGDVDFVINKTILDLNKNNLGPKGLKAVSKSCETHF